MRRSFRALSLSMQVYSSQGNWPLPRKGVRCHVITSLPIKGCFIVNPLHHHCPLLHNKTLPTRHHKFPLASIFFRHKIFQRKSFNCKIIFLGVSESDAFVRSSVTWSCIIQVENTSAIWLNANEDAFAIVSVSMEHQTWYTAQCLKRLLC